MTQSGRTLEDDRELQPTRVHRSGNDPSTRELEVVRSCLKKPVRIVAFRRKRERGSAIYRRAAGLDDVGVLDCPRACAVRTTPNMSVQEGPTLLPPGNLGARAISCNLQCSFCRIVGQRADSKVPRHPNQSGEKTTEVLEADGAGMKTAERKRQPGCRE